MASRPRSAQKRKLPGERCAGDRADRRSHIALERTPREGAAGSPPRVRRHGLSVRVAWAASIRPRRAAAVPSPSPSPSPSRSYAPSRPPSPNSGGGSGPRRTPRGRSRAPFTAPVVDAAPEGAAALADDRIYIAGPSLADAVATHGAMPEATPRVRTHRPCRGPRRRPDRGGPPGLPARGAHRHRREHPHPDHRQRLPHAVIPKAGRLRGTSGHDLPERAAEVGPAGCLMRSTGIGSGRAELTHGRIRRPTA